MSAAPVLDAPAHDHAAAVQHSTCPECLAAFAPHAHGQLFCTPAHKRAWNNRWLARGGSGIMFAAIARATRNGTRGGSNGIMTAGWRSAQLFDRKLREWDDEDRTATPPRMLLRDFMRLRWESGYFDLT